MVLAAAVCIASSSLATSPAHGSRARRTVHSYALAPGITLRTVRYAKPNQVRMLIIQPQLAPSLEQVTADDFGRWVLISRLAVQNGSFAAVNGDFGSFERKPSHWNLVDGELRTSGVMANQAIAWNKGGRRAWAGTPPRKILGKGPTGAFKVDSFNAGQAGAAEIAAFTQVGGSKEKPGSNGVCSVKMIPAAPMRWSNATKSGIKRVYTVTAVPACGSSVVFGSTAPPGEVILQVRSSCACAKTITDLVRDDKVRLIWSSWPGAVDQIGAQPELIHHGVNVAPGPHTSRNYFYGKNPRTGVGVTKGCTDQLTTTDCIVYVITVDGRQAGWSVGMTLPQFANLFLKPNPPAYDAVNLDGGGATEMWVSTRNPAYCQSSPIAGGCLVDRPAEGHERPTISSLQVLNGSDTDLTLP